MAPPTRVLARAVTPPTRVLARAVTPPTRVLALALTAAIVLAGCGSGDKSSAGDFQGEQKAVAQTVEDLQTAGRKGDADKICTDLLAASLVQTIRRASGECAKAV